MNIPNQAAEHYYLVFIIIIIIIIITLIFIIIKVTDAIPEVDSNWPIIEDPQSYTYIRPEGVGLMVGLFEGEAAAWNPKAIPQSFSFGEIEPDWERMTPYLEKAMKRVPITEKSGIKKLFCGPESFSPDGITAFLFIFFFQIIIFLEISIIISVK